MIQVESVYSTEVPQVLFDIVGNVDYAIKDLCFHTEAEPPGGEMGRSPLPFSWKLKDYLRKKLQNLSLQDLSFTCYKWNVYQSTLI